MRRFSRFIVLGIAALGATFSLHAEKGASAQSDASSKGGAKSAMANPQVAPDIDLFLWSSPDLWNQLSSGLQMKLIAKFGRPKGQPFQHERQQQRVSSPGGRATEGLSSVAPNAVIPNFNVNDPAADVGTSPQVTQNETTVTLGQGFNVVAGFNDSGSFGGTVATAQFTGFSVSTNNGVNWTDKGKLTYAPGVGDAGDPVLARSSRSGSIFFATLPFLITNQINVFRSVGPSPAIFTGGNFSVPVNGTPGLVNGSDGVDKEWLAVDNAPGAAGSGWGNVYLIVRNFSTTGGNMLVFRSTDDGLTFGPPNGTNIVAGQQGGWITVGPDHAVYAFYQQFADGYVPNAIKMRKSTDQGVTFGATVNVATLSASFAGIGPRQNRFPEVVVHPSNPNWLYCTFNDDPAGADRRDVFYSFSTDGGSSWSARVKINKDATTRDQFQSTLAITTDGKKVFFGWYDRRLDAANSLINRFGAIVDVAVDGTLPASNASFTNFLTSTSSFPAVFGNDPVVNPTYMGDYDNAAADDDAIVDIWGDNRLAASAPDVRAARIPVGGPGPILVFKSAAIGAGNGNGLIDPKECDTVRVTVTNLGTSTATNVKTTLVSSTPGITITNIPQTVSDIAANADGTTPAPGFYMTVGPGFICGNPVDFTLIITTDQGTFTLPFSLPTNFSLGAAGPVARFDNNVGGVINDNATLASSVNVALAGQRVGKVTVSLYINHTFDSDLFITLQSPGGRQVLLAFNEGGAGNDFGTSCAPEGNRTTFDDAAATYIFFGAPPFTGSFFPEGFLSDFIGDDPNGTWTLLVQDTATIDTGTLNCWSLFITPRPLVCTDAAAGSFCPLTVQLNAAVAASTVGTISGAAPLNVNFTGFALGGSGTYIFNLDFGDGTPAVNFPGTPATPVPHTYSLPGSYTATLKVTDAVTLATATDTVGITVTDPVVTPIITSISPQCGNMSGGTSVAIGGSNFTPLVTVKLAGIPVTSIVDTPTGISVTSGAYVPVGPSVTGDVVVANPGPCPGSACATVINGYTYVVRGDANNNGIIDGGDLIRINGYLGNPSDPIFPIPFVCSGDANRNGFIDGGDIIYLNQFLSGLNPNPGP